MIIREIQLPEREVTDPDGVRDPSPLERSIPPLTFRRLLGDVVISVPTAVRQAQDAGRTVSEELITLLVHGILHLCGYDHERNDREAARMFRREHAILQRLGPIPQLVSFSTRKRRKRH